MPGYAQHTFGGSLGPGPAHRPNVEVKAGQMNILYGELNSRESLINCLVYYNSYLRFYIKHA